jgi:hypothetical protein
MKLPKLLYILPAALILIGSAAQAQTEDYWGQVALYSDSTGINGVAVSLYDSAHTVTFYDTTHTDSALAEFWGFSSPHGMYLFDDVPVRDDYWVEIVVPEGYQLAVDPNQYEGWNANPHFTCDLHQILFFLVLEDTTTYNFEPRTIGFWSHQATVAVTGRGNAQVPPDELQDLFNEIFTQFNGAQYFPIQGVSSWNGAPLTAANALATFNLPNGGPQGMVNKAKKHLLAMLLNVVADYVSLEYVVSADGHTAEEAIAFGADMITNSGSAIATAKDVLDYINNGWVVPAGWIPNGYQAVNYSGSVHPAVSVGSLPTTPALAEAYPNPFNPTTAISFQLAQAGRVNLGVYDISGRLVATLVNGWREAGSHLATFDAQGLSGGVYLFNLQAGEFSTTGKLVLLK